MKPIQQRGAAVIMVMLIVALASAMAVHIALQQHLWQRQIEAQFDHAQARRFGIAGIDWARAILADDASSNAIDHETEMWTLRLPAMPVEHAIVSGTIEDRQGLFNLNSLVHKGVVSPSDVAKFRRLLILLDLPIELASTLSDWIDTDHQPLPAGGAEDAYYLSLPRPYRTGNRPLIEVSELARIKGYDPHTVARLEAFVTALPVNGGINVNFASAEVLASVAQHLSLSDARMLIQQRRGAPYKSIADFRMRLPYPGIVIADSDLTVSSAFFRITGRAAVNNSRVITQVLVQRAEGWPVIIWQSVQ